MYFFSNSTLCFAKYLSYNYKRVLTISLLCIDGYITAKNGGILIISYSNSSSTSRVLSIVCLAVFGYNGKFVNKLVQVINLNLFQCMEEI